MKSSLAVFLVFASALPGQQEPNHEGRRLALVVTNSAYEKLPRQNSSGEEGRLITEALTESGFSVRTISEMRFPEFLTTGEEPFLRSVQRGDTVAFFFAGYAVQGDDDNYLLPVNFDPQNTADLERRAYHLSRMQQKLDEKGAGLKIFVLNAGHRIDVPVRGMGAPGMMSQPAVSRDSLFGFSTSPGQTVSRDAPDPFVRSIAQHATQPGIHIVDLLNAAKRDVVAGSGGGQVPSIQENVVHDIVLKQAPLSVTPDSLTFAAPLWNAAPPAQAFLAYAGGYVGSFSVSRPAEARWLRVTPAEGLLSSGNTPNVTVSVDPQNLIPGNTYTARLRVSGNSPEWTPEPRDVQITFTVPEKPALPPPPPKQGPKPGIVYSNRLDREGYLLIPGGSFLMGCASGDTLCKPEEKPQHQVSISKDFFLGRNEVEVEAYKQFAEKNSRKMPAGPGWDSKWKKDDLPVVNETWDEAAKYCAWVGGRLPTEAEWEFAARGAKEDEVYPFADENSRDVANFAGRKATVQHDNEPAPVRKFFANPFGLYDMAGNVWEWVADYFAADYYGRSEPVDPQGPESGKKHVMRGGSFDSGAREHLRISIRRDASGGNSLGFRCAMDDNSDTRKLLDIPADDVRP